MNEISLKNPVFFNFIESNGYYEVIELPDGTIAALYKLIYTTAICTNLSWHGYGNRFCFKDESRAKQELLKLKDCDDVPEGWVARR